MRIRHRVLILFLAVAIAGCTNRRQPSAEYSNEDLPLKQEGAGFYRDVAWSPDGSALTVSVMEKADTQGVFLYRVCRLGLDPPGLHVLTSGPMDLWTSWSPDGEHIAYASRTGENSDIFRMSADGSNPVRLTDNLSDDTQPAWSPDGRRIVFVSDRDGTKRVYVMNEDGSREARVGETDRDAQNPVWSPDGRQIVYYETDSTGRDEIYVMNADGSGRHRVTMGVWPHWAPGRNRILFGGPQGLSLINTDGTGDLLLVPGAEFGAFSPDEKKIAYIISGDGSVSVNVMNPDGSGKVHMLERPAQER